MTAISPERRAELEALAAEVVNQFNPIAGHIVLRDLVLDALLRAESTRPAAQPPDAQKEQP
jgi:hypothetical protein